jgi:hypothetical protein
VLAILLAATGPRAGEAAGAPSHETCASKAALLVQKIGLKNRAQDLVTLSPAVEKGRIEVTCPIASAEPIIRISYPSEYPPDTFYLLLADIASTVTSEKAQRMRLRVHRCHRAAKRSLGGRTVKRFGAFRIACDRHPSRSSFELRARQSAARD